MPTYQYKREDGTVFEVLQKMSDDPLATCPDTGQKVHRIISGGAGVVYKGDGFYITDYKRKDEQKSNANSSNGSSSGSSNGTAPSKTDSQTSSTTSNDKKSGE